LLHLTIGSPESVVKANHIGLPNAWHPVTAKLIDSIRYGAGIIAYGVMR
jgi:hypothetical protein